MIDLSQVKGKGQGKLEIALDDVIVAGVKWHVVLVFDPKTALFSYSDMRPMATPEPAPTQPEPSIPSDGPIIPKPPEKPDWPPFLPNVPDEPTQPIPEPTTPEPDEPDDNTIPEPTTDGKVITLRTPKHTGYFSFSPAEYKMFKFSGNVPDCLHPIQIGNVPQSQEPHTVHMVIKRGTKPRPADFDKLVKLGASLYDCGTAKISNNYIEIETDRDDNYWISGISVMNSDKSTISDNTIIIFCDNSGTGFVGNADDACNGIALYGVEQSTIANNVIKVDNADKTYENRGIELTSSCLLNYIQSNVIDLIDNNASDIGIYIASGCNNNCGANLTYNCGTVIDDNGTTNAVTSKDV